MILLYFYWNRLWITQS